MEVPASGRVEVQMQVPPKGEPGLAVHAGLDVAIDLPVASVGSRSAAYIFDMLVLFLGWLVLASVAAIANPGQLPSPQTLGMLAAGWFFSQFLMFSIQETVLDGQTYGKRLMGIRVVDAQGNPPGAGAALLRNLLRPVDNLPYAFSLGTFLVAFSRTGRRLGDLAAGTRVVHDLPPPPDLPELVIPTDASASEVAVLETWALRARTLDPGPKQALAERLVAWIDTRWPGHLPPADAALTRLDAGLHPTP